MPKVSTLKFYNYTVEELAFKNNPISTPQQEFELHPQFRHHVTDCGEGNYDVCLAVELNPTAEHPMPFHLRVSIVGHFSVCCTDDRLDDTTKETLLKKNSVSILFPFLRAIVASLTMNANVPTLVLPIMDFSDND